MEREPAAYSRLVVLLGLGPLLVADLLVGLPEGAFVGGGAIVLVVAAGVHIYGGERRAGGGWVMFAAALGVAALVDLTANILHLVSFGLLLAAGLVLLASQRIIDADDD